MSRPGLPESLAWANLSVLAHRLHGFRSSWWSIVPSKPNIKRRYGWATPRGWWKPPNQSSGRSGTTLHLGRTTRTDSEPRGPARPCRSADGGGRQYGRQWVIMPRRIGWSGETSAEGPARTVRPRPTSTRRWCKCIGTKPESAIGV